MAEGGTILIAEHDSVARAEAEAVAARLGFDAISAESAELLLEQVDGERPALAIIEVELPGRTSGFELLRELHARFGESVPVILVSGERTAALDRTVGLLLGADDYLLKPVDPGELLARTRCILRRCEARSGNDSRHLFALSRRERQILGLLAEGKTQTQIAAKLVISPKTVGTHIQHLLGKLGVNSRAQAVAAAYRSGLLSDDVAAHALPTAFEPAELAAGL